MYTCSFLTVYASQLACIYVCLFVFLRYCYTKQTRKCVKKLHAKAEQRKTEENRAKENLVVVVLFLPFACLRFAFEVAHTH